jgi:hypothetical protein
VKKQARARARLTAPLVAALVAAACAGLSSSEVFSTKSPRGGFVVAISQERPFPGVERHVYLDAYRAGALVVQHKLLFTGDFLDDDFRRLYPASSWVSESVLAIGQLAGTGDDTLRVTNDTARRLAYVLIETHRHKFILLDVEPRAAITLRFDYAGRLSAEGYFQDSVARFADAVVLPGETLSVEGGQFSARVSENIVTIDGPRGLRHVPCCAVDRPR